MLQDSRIILFLLVFPFLVISNWSHAGEGNRLALVIGNSDYTNGGSLENPVNDARLMTETLSSLGFKVIALENASLDQMQNSFKNFASEMNRYDVALFYYAGHGIQVDGKNYLIPIDATLKDKMSLEFEAFNIESVNQYFAQRQSKMNIMILDACRDNPFRTWSRGGSRGFTAIKNQGAGTIISYATKEGETASDGDGKNGLYTKHLVEQMKVKQGINDVFLNTRIAVLRASQNRQVPQEWNMLTGNFYFVDSNINAGEITNISTHKRPEEKVEMNYFGTSVESFINEKGTFVDERDNQSYRSIGYVFTDTDGKKIYMNWMIDNLAYFSTESFKIPNKNEVLYSWSSAIRACPKGWHLPSEKEWVLLVNNLGGMSTAGKKLKSSSGWAKNSWGQSGNGDNSSSFEAFPFGYRNDFGTYSSQGKTSYFWARTSKSETKAVKSTMHYNDSEVSINPSAKSSAFSCRCVKN